MLRYNPDGILIDEARRMRAAGVPASEIAKALGLRLARVYRRTNDCVPPKQGKSVRIPDDPILAERIRLLARRGFDVPPSKRADYENLARKGVTVPERRRMLGLE
jgi:hypothetical protein